MNKNYGVMLRVYFMPNGIFVNNNKSNPHVEALIKITFETFMESGGNSNVFK